MSHSFSFGSSATVVIDKKASRSISIARFVAILGVVYIHAYMVTVNYNSGVLSLQIPEELLYLENLVSQVLTRFAVPLLFLISSFLLFRKERDWLGNLKAKVRSLLIPYAIWNTAWIVVWLIAAWIPGLSRFFSGHLEVGSIGDLLRLYGLGDYPHVYQLWFIRDLFLFNVVAPLVWIVVDRLPKVTTIICLLIAVAPFDIPFKQGMPWFILGACLARDADLRGILSSAPLIPLAALYVVYSLIGAFDYMGVVAQVAIGLGVLSWLKIPAHLEESSCGDRLVSLSSWSFFVYAFHEPMLTMLKKLCIAMLPGTGVILLFEYVFLPVLDIALCLAFGALFKVAAPRLYALSTGGRT